MKTFQYTVVCNAGDCQVLQRLAMPTQPPAAGEEVGHSGRSTRQTVFCPGVGPQIGLSGDLVKTRRYSRQDAIHFFYESKGNEATCKLN